MATILIVDDDDNNRDYLRTLLGFQGHVILEASNGEEALENVQQRQSDLDLIIADLLMPQMDGFELACRLRSAPETALIPMLFSSAHYFDAQARELATALGVQGILEKPVPADVMLQRVAQALASPPLEPTEINEAFDRVHRRLVSTKLAQLAGQLLVSNDQRLAHGHEVLPTANGPRNFVSKQFPLTENGLVRGIGGISADFTDGTQAEVQLANLALHDPLTGLPNRALLMERLSLGLANAKYEEAGLAVLFLDLDGLKTINDALGHEEGDNLLREVAARLLRCVRDNDTVARFAGDEFVLLLADIDTAGESAVTKVVRKIQGVLSQPVTLDGRAFVMTASIGISLYSAETGSSPQLLLKQADIAMYRAKTLGKNTFQVYAPDMLVAVEQRLEMEQRLRQALADHEFAQFKVYYQPKVDVSSGRIVGIEALLRWSVNGAPVDVGTFIALAERTGLITPLGQWVLSAACHQAKRWRQAGLLPGRVAVNLSARQFLQADIAKTIQAALRKAELDGSELEVELTETVLMQDTASAQSTIQAIKALGVAVSIDDFGTGYSSLAYLRLFLVDSIKIDLSFVQGRETVIAASIIALGHKLGLRAIAEGVETKEQLAFLAAHHCDEVQGYYYSEPLPEVDMTALLSKYRSMACAPAEEREAAMLMS